MIAMTVEEKGLHPRLLRLHEYWLSAASSGELPGRKDICPGEMREALPFITLVEVDHTSPEIRFRFRLVGTAIVNQTHRDMTGRTFEEAYSGESYEHQMRTYREVVTSGLPFYSVQRLPVPNRDFIEYERLLLPLATTGREVDMLISVALFHQTIDATSGGSSDQARCVMSPIATEERRKNRLSNGTRSAIREPGSPNVGS